MHPDSLYAHTCNDHTTHPQQSGDEQVDVAIVGAGITGLSAALELAKRGYRVAVLEARDVAWGASGRSGGQIIAGAGDHPGSVMSELGAEGAKALFQLSLEAMDLIKSRVAEYRIDCDLCLGQVEVAAKPGHVSDIEHLARLYNDTFGYPVQSLDAAQVAALTGSEAYYAGCYDPLGGHLHPMNYTLGLARAASQLGVKIYEHSPVTHIQAGDPVSLRTPQGALRCAHLVIAANAYLDKLVPKLARYILPVGSYICATAPVPDSVLPENPAVVDSKYLLSYFRKDASGRLLWGGRTGLTRHEPSNLRRVMLGRIAHAYPQLSDIAIEKSWGGNVAITMNRMPQFGRLAANQYYIHGYSGHGIALSNLGGLTLAEAISGQAERFDLFAEIPHKPYPGGTRLRAPALAAAMVYFWLKDRLG